jgi:two-component system chemotaxis response regulator CheY
VKNAQKVLIAEDSAIQAEGLKCMLESAGFDNVTIAANGLIAVEYYKQELSGSSPYSLVFLDIIMPEMDGQEALRLIRAAEKEHGATKSVIIMTTALGSPKDMMDALLEGDCTDYIVKPVEEDDLQSILERHAIVDKNGSANDQH